MEFNEDELPCSLDVGLKRVVDKIVIEINKVHQGKCGASYSDIVNYINGHGDLAFTLQDEKGLRRGELIGDLSGEELSKIIEWCFQYI
ncbi:hypothetical protein ES705_16883 [subsurface metagenome]